jgi:hypothetical protein
LESQNQVQLNLISEEPLFYHTKSISNSSLKYLPTFQVVIPIIEWEEATFSRPVLAMVLFTCIALFPSFLLPSSPCMWTAGMAFGYGYGFLIITGAISIGMSLPFFIGSLFHERLHVSMLEVNSLFSLDDVIVVYSYKIPKYITLDN